MELDILYGHDTAESTNANGQGTMQSNRQAEGCRALGGAAAKAGCSGAGEEWKGKVVEQ